MTAFKELKFTSENLEKHLEAVLPWFLQVHGCFGGYGKFIVTTRDEKKGEIGDVFFIEGAGYYALIDCTCKWYGELTVSKDYRDEGFESCKEYLEELIRLYSPDGEHINGSKEFYIHTLVKLNLSKEMIKDGC